MKRLSIAVAVIALVALIVYQLLFTDRRLRLNVSANPPLAVAAMSFHTSGEKIESVVSGERMLVYDGRMEFEADSIFHVRDAIKKLVEASGGYVVSENQTTIKGKVYFNQSLRVPSAAMEEVIRRIEGLAGTINAKRISAIDVTEEFIDVKSRVLTKKKAETRYQEILKEAKTVEDIMKIEDKISIVRGEIESIEGRLNYLENQVTLGTLDIEFHEPGTGATAGFGYELVGSLKNGWQGMLAFVAGVANVWPVVILIAFGLWIFRRRITGLVGQGISNTQ